MASFGTEGINAVRLLQANAKAKRRIADEFVAGPLIDRHALVPLFAEDCRHGARAVPEPTQVDACVKDRQAFTAEVRAFVSCLEGCLADAGMAR
ncbi:hypothetical protein [Pseudoduganella lurida]|uniref:hypothetical protein n=1 Tax=Pseudoduganella lurida TaxID=1036180 RepID=UPI0011A3FF0A|nr:hypothetical protein [Pseudoduganella lurida]